MPITSVWVCEYICECACECVWVLACACVCVGGCVLARVYMCVCMYEWVCVWVLARACLCVCEGVCVRACSCMCVCVCVRNFNPCSAWSLFTNLPYVCRATRVLSNSVSCSLLQSALQQYAHHTTDMMLINPSPFALPTTKVKYCRHRLIDPANKVDGNFSYCGFSFNI